MTLSTWFMQFIGDGKFRTGFGSRPYGRYVPMNLARWLRNIRQPSPMETTQIHGWLCRLGLFITLISYLFIYIYTYLYIFIYIICMHRYKIIIETVCIGVLKRHSHPPPTASLAFIELNLCLFIFKNNSIFYAIFNIWI